MGCTSSRPAGDSGEVSRLSRPATKEAAGHSGAAQSEYPPAELAPSSHLVSNGSLQGQNHSSLAQGPGQAIFGLQPAAPVSASPPAQPDSQQAPGCFLQCPLPKGDARTAALASSCLCAGLPEDRFDHFTKLVKGLLKVPMCQITLVADDMVHGKSAQGIGRGSPQLPRDVAFCSWALLPKNPTLLVVEDATVDGRFRDNPVVVGPPHIRFYAGAPLIASDGHALGTLCGMDFEPRRMDGHILQILSRMAELVMREIEQDLAANLIPGASPPQWAGKPPSNAATLTTPTSPLDPAALASTESMTSPAYSIEKPQRRNSEILRRSSIRNVEDLKHGFMLCQAGNGSWPVLFATDTWCTMVGMSLDKVAHRSLWDIFEVDPWTKEAALASLAKGTREVEIGAAVKAKSSLKAFNLTFKQHNGDLDASTVSIGIPSFINASAAEAPDLCFVMVSEATQLVPASGIQAVGTPIYHQPSGQMTATVPAEIFTSVSLGPLLGKGSFGKVFRGTWQDITVAVKILEKVLQPEDRAGGLDNMQHSLEATLGVGLDHNNLVRTLACHSRLSRGMVGHVRGIDRPIGPNEPCVLESWILLEYCGKGSLLDALSKGWLRTERSLVEGAPNFRSVLATASEIAQALQYLHAANILHGDLTCNNMMLQGCESDERGFTAKVGDFGMSRLMDMESDSMETSSHGTVTHMPPELLMSGRLSRATDVYSFGVVLWELYTARRAFAGLMSHQIFLRITQEGLQLPFPNGTPPAYAALSEACRALDDTQRPSFSEISERLREMQEGPDLQPSILPFCVLELTS